MKIREGALSSVACMVSSMNWKLSTCAAAAWYKTTEALLVDLPPVQPPMQKSLVSYFSGAGILVVDGWLRVVS